MEPNNDITFTGKIYGYQLKPEPIPFDIDRHVDEFNSTQPIENSADNRGALAKTFGFFTDPFIRQGYVASAALNRGIAAFSQHLDNIAGFIEESTGMKRGKLFENAAKVYEDNAEYWQKLAEEKGIGFLDEMFGEAAGGFVPGLAQFMLDVGSGLTFSYMGGAYEGYKQGESPFEKGMLEATKTGMLATIFRFMAPLKQYLRAPTMGTVFGTQAAMEAPEGKKGREFAKGFGIGVGYSLTSPGGQMGLNEVVENIKPAIKDFQQRMADETGAVGKKPSLKSEDLKEKQLQEITFEEFRQNNDLKPWAKKRKGGDYYATITGPLDVYGFGNTPKEAKEDFYRKYYNKVISQKQEILKTIPEIKSEIKNEAKSHIERKESLEVVKEIVPEEQRKTIDLKSAEWAERWQTVTDEFFSKHPELTDNQKLEVIRSAFLGVNETGFEGGGELSLELHDNYLMPASREYIRNKMEEPPSGQKRQRKFLKTLEESEKIEPDFTEEIKKIKPQDYFIKPNKESFETARKMVEENPDQTVDFVMSDQSLSAEKGAAFHELIKKYQRERNFDKAIEIIEEYDRQGREAGRFIQTAAQWSKLLSPEGFIRWANKQLDKSSKVYSWADSLLKLKPEDFKLTKEEEKIILERYREMDNMSDIDRADATLELIDIMAKKVPPSVSELIDAYRYQNMLSSPKTQMRNIGYNQAAMLVARPWDLTTRGAIDYIKSGITGKEREAYINDVPTYYKAVINAVPNAVIAFKNVMKLEKGTTLEKPDLGVEAKTEFQKARAKQIPGALTIVQRFMEASDKFNMSLISAGELAVNLKNGMPEADAHAKATEISKEYLLRAEIDPKDPRYSLPSQALASLYKMMDATRKLPVVGPVSRWFVPFLRTPTNLGINMIEYSPLGLARTSVNAETSAKLLSGGIITALGATVAYLGETTWTPPSDPDEKALFYRSGRRPYSIKMGDYWIPIWYLGPYALSFAVPMAVKYYTQDSKSSMTDDSFDKLINISGGLARFIGSQSSTQSIGSLFSALDGDIDYKLSSQTGFTIQQMVPGASLIRYVNTIIDPVYRHPQGFIENIEVNLPILSKNLDAYMTPFLEESRREPINYFLPYDIGKTDEIYETLYDISQVEIINANGKKLDRLIDRMKANPMSIDKSLEEYMKIINPDIKMKGVEK